MLDQESVEKGLGPCRLLSGFQPYLNTSSSSSSFGGVGGNLVAAVAFSARLAQADAETVDAPLAEKAIENLLSALTWKAEEKEANGAEKGEEGHGALESGACMRLQIIKCTLV